MVLIIKIFNYVLIFTAMLLNGTNGDSHNIFPTLKTFLWNLGDAVSDTFGNVTLNIFYNLFNKEVFAIDHVISKIFGPGSSERCSWEFNESSFNLQINQEFFGQHIAELYISKLVSDHVNADKPKKPLVMSFQGPPGVGKSLLSKIIVKNLYTDGFDSKFVHVFHGSLDFPHEHTKNKYCEKLLLEIPLYLSMCERSVFIFEELNLMTPGVIDVLLPYFNSNDGSKNKNFFQSIFMFLSNSGSEDLENILFNSWLEGGEREDFGLGNFSLLLQKAAYSEPGGLQHSSLITRNLIDIYVPFLPLEKAQVRQCIYKELKSRGLPVEKDIIEQIANTLEYHPRFYIYSESGCKRVSQKIDLYDFDDT